MKSIEARSWAVLIAKYAVSLGLLSYLAWQAWTDDSLRDLQFRTVNWGMLVGAFAVGLGATAITFLRWQLLVRALGIPFSSRDALEIGFIGHLFTFFTVGVVGGDAVRAYYIARHRPDRRAEAIATVILDRAIGLLALFYVAAFGYFYLRVTQFDRLGRSVFQPLHAIGAVSCVVCVVATIVIAATMATPLLAHPALDRLGRIPFVGRTALDLLAALRTYRAMPLVAFAASFLSVLTNLGAAVAIWGTAVGLGGDHPTLAEHLVAVPVAMLATIVPLPAGLGAFEVALAYLYQVFGEPNVVTHEGILVAFAYRLMTVLYAVLGAYFFLTRRRQVVTMLAEAKHRRDHYVPATAKSN
ncbi:MAG TPA: lysylphosphatidylglycerol synthase transmembrane domain-containing protein [Pirellulaceae bacterium]|nr:lysylphosphatidylglycerol synthase transmembrane domain-containing protein [Pirellulaceae bacterium]